MTHPLLISLVIAAALCRVSHAAQPAPPNVVIILTDDQGYGDLSCHGNPVLKTPHLDQLHAESVRLTDFHVSPVCSPTRAALLTGRDPLRAGVWTTTTDRSRLLADIPTLADLFAADGYRTGMFGKWHLGDAPPHRPQDRGFQETLYLPGGMTGFAAETWDNDVIDPVFHHNGAREKFTGYREDILFNKAMEWMSECQRNGQPFFTYLATFSPHGPCLVPEKYASPYRKGPGKQAADFLGMVANIDENVGRLEAFLRENGLRDNTLLVFMSDNGGTGGVRIHNSGMKGNKGDAYEGGHRVPCFFRWPDGGLGGGRDVGGLTAHIDLLPTLAELCGLEKPLPKGLDGVSLAPLLRGETTTAPDRSLFVRYDPGIKSDPQYRPDSYDKAAVLQGRWRLIDGRELYDIQADPGQKKDVASEHPEIVAQLRDAQDAFWKEIHPGTFHLSRPTLLGSEEILLTPLDARPTTGDSVAQQAQIRQGKPTFGEYSVRLPGKATLHIEARRWPRESGAALTAPLSAFKGPLVKRPPGKPLPIHSLRVRVGDVERTIPAAPDAPAIIAELPVEPGEHILTARFLDAGGHELTDAYFLHLSTTKP